MSAESTEKQATRDVPPPPPPDDEEEHHGLRLDRKTVLPALAILALLVVPVLIWAATSGGSGDQLRIDQGVSVYGEPEIVVNVPKKLNTPAEAHNATSVKLTCVDGGGNTILGNVQPWPFINEVGYPYPHIHQPVTPKQLQAIAKCRLDGLKTKLQGQPIDIPLSNLQLRGFAIQSVSPLDPSGWIRVNLVRVSSSPAAGIQ